MTQLANTIEHPGTITRIGKDEIEVMIMSSSACASCQVKGACSLSEMEEKIVTVKKPARKDFKPGQQVVVFMYGNTGFKAVFFGYILPFILVIASLVIIISTGNSEGIAGLSALVILAIYYLLLYTLRNHINKSFEFFIK